MCKEDLVLNNLKGLICQKQKTTKLFVGYLMPKLSLYKNSSDTI